VALLRGLCGGFQVSPGGRDVRGVKCGTADVAVQDGVDEMVAGSSGAGLSLGATCAASQARAAVRELELLTDDIA